MWGMTCSPLERIDKDAVILLMCLHVFVSIQSSCCLFCSFLCRLQPDHVFFFHLAWRYALELLLHLSFTLKDFGWKTRLYCFQKQLLWSSEKNKEPISCTFLELICCWQKHPLIDGYSFVYGRCRDVLRCSRRNITTVTPCANCEEIRNVLQQRLSFYHLCLSVCVSSLCGWCLFLGFRFDFDDAACMEQSCQSSSHPTTISIDIIEKGDIHALVTWWDLLLYRHGNIHLSTAPAWNATSPENEVGGAERKTEEKEEERHEEEEKGVKRQKVFI